ncbi:MAG: hypothetical protein HY926_01020 [Elusimicrobia bacterium]|nr:hypothetical protein [Elusimicrobiota bacterium]
MPPARHLWLTLLLGLLALAAHPAAAQDCLGEPQASDAFSWPRRRADVIASPAPAAVLEPAAQALPVRVFQKEGAARPAALLRLTRLAGMFMGRVSPLSWGSMRICFKLDIQ